MCHITERATAGAEVAKNHECRGAFTEALADIGAGGFFAYGMQILLPQNTFNLVELLTIG
jgi:hypothetical protein